MDNLISMPTLVLRHILCWDLARAFADAPAQYPFFTFPMREIREQSIPIVSPTTLWNATWPLTFETSSYRPTLADAVVSPWLVEHDRLSLERFKAHDCISFRTWRLSTKRKLLIWSANVYFFQRWVAVARRMFVLSSVHSVFRALLADNHTMLLLGDLINVPFRAFRMHSLKDAFVVATFGPTFCTNPLRITFCNIRSPELVSPIPTSDPLELKVTSRHDVNSSFEIALMHPTIVSSVSLRLTRIRTAVGFLRNAPPSTCTSERNWVGRIYHQNSTSGANSLVSSGDNDFSQLRQLAPPDCTGVLVWREAFGSEWSTVFTWACTVAQSLWIVVLDIDDEVDASEWDSVVVAGRFMHSFD